MDEFKFVLRCFMFSALIILFSQVKMNDQTLESKAEIFLQDSTTAHFLQQSAEGGAQFLSKTYQTSMTYLKKKMAQAGGSNEPSKYEN